MRNATNYVRGQLSARPILSALFVWLLFSGGVAFAQDGFFVPLTTAQARLAAPGLDAIEKYGMYQLKTSALRDYLAKAPLENRVTTTPLRLAIPLPDGTTELFVMAESPILAPAVAAQHPDIKTYTGTGTTHPAYTIRLSLTASGFDAIVLGVGNGAVYVTKVTGDSGDQRYATYFARDVKKSDPVKPFGNLGKCGTLAPAVDALPGRSAANARAALNNTGTTLRTFRLAVAATKGFTNTKGGKTVDGSFNAVVGYVNRLNAVYRRELSVAFTLVSGTNTIFTDQSDGGYVDGGGGGQASTRNQVVLDNIIKDANYDIGHVLGYGGGSGEGIAASKSACVTGHKADAYTGVGDGSFAPVFDDQAFNHEVGHQFGMTHTFNSSIPVCTTRDSSTSVEPGAGTTIMSYGYTCSSKNDPNANDNYESTYQPFLNFHTISYQQAIAYINTLSCFTSTPLNNAVPVISNFPSNVTIPRSTPFSLSATATDANASDKLTYSWEGTNIGELYIKPDNTVLANTAKGPFFRSYEPVPNSVRTYPRLEAILDGSNYAKGDKLPSVGVATTHVLTVRDNVGGVTFQGVTVTIDGNSGPFLETTNLSGTHPANSVQTISWNVANTTAPPVNCAAVNILLSTDGGQTFPIVLLADAPNTGTASVRFPDVRTTQARIKIAGSNTIFFDISNANFTIGDPVVLTGAPIVKVSSTDPSASEGGSNGNGRLATPGGRRAATDPGFIQFERSSGQGTLVVNYTIEGTATNGVDFTTLPTSIVFAEGQTVVTEELDPLEDDLVENDETVVITLLDSDSYDPDPDNLTTTVTIKDRVTTSFAITGVTTVGCIPVVGDPNRRSLTFLPQYSGTSGQPISFSVVNEMLPTTTAGPYVLSIYIDNPTITLKATQSGTTGEASFVYNWLAACGSKADVQGRMAKEIGTQNSMVIRVLGNPITDGRVYIEITGAAGQPLQLHIVNTRGTVVSSHRIEQSGSIERYTFDVGRQPVGTLLLRVATPTQANTITLLKAE